MLYLRQVNRYLALVSIVRTENFEKQGMIEHNFNCFKSAIEEVFQVRAKMLERQRRAIRNGATIAEINSMTAMSASVQDRVRAMTRNASNDTINSGQSSVR